MGSFLIRSRSAVLAAICFLFLHRAAGVASSCMAGDESTASQNPVADDVAESSETESAEEQQARLANQRFLTLLKKQPRPGTALDRVYAFHMDRGTLEQFLSEQRSLMAEGDDDGVACLLVGLIETKEGNHSAADQAFELAEQRRPQDAIASWMRGRSLLELQKPYAAAVVLERAIERAPQKADLLVVYQDLGRAYRRSLQTEKANMVWQRMESQFPDDLRVKEEIASTLLAEGDVEAALGRYVELAGLHRDPYQKAQYAITAAELKLQSGRRDEALHDLEAQLQTLDPESWLARDIRRRIDQSFLQNNDQAGLVSYYETWLQNHPDDLEVTASLGHALASQGRGLDAMNLYRKALEKAPSNIALRKERLSLLTQEKLFNEAAAEYAELHQLDPGNNQHLEAWGLMALRRDDQPLTERHANAVAIWKRMLQIRPDDPRLLVQVAELIRRTELSEEALTLYRRAVELQPSDPQYREYLGDYLQALGRSDEAIRAWEAIATGDQRNTANLNRLAEILQAAGLPEKALSTLQAACELTPEFSDRLKLARWLREYELDGRYPRAIDALKQLDLAESLAETDEERRLILEERIQSLIAAKQLQQAIGDLSLKLRKTEDAGDPVAAEQVKKNAADWAELAAYFEAAKEFPGALEAVKKSTMLAPEAVGPWTLSAKLYERTGRLADAVDAYQKLLSLDLRSRSGYLQKIANLEQRLGRRAEALKAGQALLAAGPDNPEFIKFYADLCFHFGDRQEALKTLRRSVRSSSADGPLILELARTLANQNEVDEATSLCWLAFEKSASLDERTNTVMMLAELALRTNRLDQLIEKLEQHGRVSGQEQESVQCLAVAFRVAGDLQSARRALERLLAADGRDSQLLLQVSRLAEEDGDLEAATEYQRRANSVMPSEEGETRLASLLMRLGDLSEAEALWNRIAGETTRPAEAIQAIDQLISLESIDSAREICDRLLAQSPENWEVMVRRGLLEWRYGDREKADHIFQKVLELGLDSNTPSALQHDRLKHGDATVDAEIQRLPALARLEMVPDLVELFRDAEPSRWFGPKIEPTMPRDYGAARIVAIIGRYLTARQNKSDSEILEKLSTEAHSGHLQAICDQLALEICIADRNEAKLFKETDFQRLIQPATEGNTEAQAMYLELIARQFNVWEVDEDIESTLDNLGLRFLTAEQFALLASSFQQVLTEKPEWMEKFDAPRLFAICRHQQQLEKLDEIATGLLAQEKVGPQLSMGLDLALLRQTLTIQRSLDTLSRLAKQSDLNKQSNGGLSTAVRGEAFETIAPALLRIAHIKRLPGEEHSGLRVLDWWLEWRREFSGTQAMGATAGFEREVAQRVVESIVVPDASRGNGFTSSAQQDLFDVAAGLGVKNHFSTEEVEFLTQVFVLFLQEHADEQLTDWFHERTESSAIVSLAELEMMQAVYWSIEEHRESVLLHLVRAVEHSPNDNLLKLVVALRLEELDLKNEALELMAQLPDSDPMVLKCREFKTLQIATQLQRSELAKVAATRLVGLDLDDAEHTFFDRELGKLGLEDQRIELQSRRTKVKPDAADTSPLALLDHYEQQGNVAASVQVAQQLLRRSHQNPTPWRNTTRPTPEQIYARAYKVLKETGELDKMIERQRAQLAKSPQSGRLQKTLLEYLKAAGRNAEADQLQASWQRIQPGVSVKVMLEQAEGFVAAKQSQFACDQFLRVIQEHPGEFWDEVSTEQVLEVFAQTNRLGELSDAILLADRGRSQSYSPTNALDQLIRALLRDSTTHRNAAQVIQRYSEMYPAYTVGFLRLVESLPLWSSPELFDLLSQMYVPATPEQLRKPQLAWPMDYEFHSIQLGFDELAIHGGGNLKRLSDALKFSEERRRELELTTKETMEKLPDWPAGYVILIVCALSEPEKSLDQDRVEMLVGEMCGDGKPPVPEAVAYNLAQLLRPHGERMKGAALKLLKSSLNSVPQKDLSVGTPASRAFLELSFELNRSGEGLEFLQSALLDSPNLKLHDEDVDLPEIGARLTAGKFLLLFGRPVAAMRVLQGLTAENEALFLEKVADQEWPKITATRAARSSLLEELRNNAINAITVDQLARELRLVSQSKTASDVISLDLQTTVSGATDDSDCRPVCSLMAAIVAKADVDANAITKLVEELTNALKTPQPDLSLIAPGSAVVFRSNNKESLNKLVPALTEYLGRESLTSAKLSETPERFRRRQNAVLSFSAVAGYAIADETNIPLMIRFYEQSLVVARRDRNQAIVIGILNQLEKLQRTAGNALAADMTQKEMQSEREALVGDAGTRNSKSRPVPTLQVDDLKALLRSRLLKPLPGSQSTIAP
jgi:tetratricopeptide (TPR) repeat protein